MLPRAAAVLAVLCSASSAQGSLLPLDTEHLRASVGGFAVMNCHLDFPFGNKIPYHLHWDKDVSTHYPLQFCSMHIQNYTTELVQ